MPSEPLTDAELDAQDRCVRETHARWPNLVVSTCYRADGSGRVRWWCVQEGLPRGQGLRYRVIFPGPNFEDYLHGR